MKAIDKNSGRVGRAVGTMVIASFLFATACARLNAQDKASTPATTKPGEPEPGEYNNSLTLGVGHFIVDDDKVALKRRTQLPAGTFGGLEELHFEEAVGKKGLFQLDARSIWDNRDNLFKVDLSHPEIGYMRAGYKEFRTWYDGSGGFSPLSNAWISLYNEELHIDRRQAWFEGGLTLPDWPVFSVRYSYDVRAGLKDSTIWGDYSLSHNGSNLRAILPTFRDIDEQRHTVDADVKHTIGNTSFGVGMRYERDKIDDSLNILRRAGEPNVVRTVTQRDDTSAEIWNGHAFVETRINPKVFFTVGGSFTRLDTDIGGSRIYGPTYDSPYNPFYVNRQARDEGFLDLSGGSQVDQYVANVNLMLTPWKHVTIVPSLRIEHQDQTGAALFKETNVTGTNSVPPVDVLNNRLRRFTDVTEALDVRYTGITNWSLYARGEWLEGQGSLRENDFDVEADDSLTPGAIQRSTDSERWVQKYSVGANWYPCRKANFAAQYYYRTRRNDYDHLVDSAAFTVRPTTIVGGVTNLGSTNTSNFYPAFIDEQQFDTHDVNFRMTFRPLAGLTLVTRYDFTLTSYNMRGDTATNGTPLAEIQSAETTAHIISQSIAWSPLAQLYFQGCIGYALQRTHSPAVTLAGTASNLVQNADNDYWDASLTAGWAFSKYSDLQAQYYYYRSDNYDTSNASVGLPYGAGVEQHGVTVSLINRLRRNLLWKLQYGYFTGHDQTSGGNNDYNAHLVYSSWQYLF